MSAVSIITCTLFILSITGQSLEERDKNSMNGKHFKNAVCDQLTASYFIRNASGSVVGFYGPHLEMFEWISRRLNFTYANVPVFRYTQGALPNGTYIGMHELLRKKEVDFTTCGLLLTPSAYRVVDFTASVGETPEVLLLPPPREESRLWAPVKPFTYAIWLATVASALLTSLTTYAIHFAGNRLENRAASFTLADVAVSVTGVTFGQTEFSLRLTRSPSLRIMLAVFCLTAVVVVNSYTSSFISYATTPKLIPVARDLEEAAFVAKVQFVGTRSQNIGTFTESSSEAMREIGKQLTHHPENLFQNMPAAGEKVASGCCALLYPRSVLELWLSADLKSSGECRCSITSKAELYDFYAFGGQKGDSKVRIISEKILEAKQFGLMDYWYSKVLERPWKCLKPDKPKVRPLGFTDLSGVFLVFIGGVSFSVAVFVVEAIGGKLLRKK